MSFKKTKVVMLPTNEKANALWWSGHKLYVKSPEDPTRGELNHLYFLSDEEIKEGDWVLETLNNVIFQVKVSGNDYKNSTFKKIIATTDKSLSEQIMYYPNGAIIGGIESYKLLPQPSQSFIEKFVEEYNKGNVITEVLVEYNLMNKGYDKPEDYPYQECEILKVNPKDNTITIRKVKDSWNRDEVVELLSKHFVDAGSKIGLGQDVTKFTEKWIEKNL